MKNILLVPLIVVMLTLPARSKIAYTPVFQQTALYFTSDRVTMAGLGMGAGAGIRLKPNLVAQIDVNLLWANGNAVATRMAVGYKRNGFWTPALLSTISILSGQRTEILSEKGKLPAAPVWVIGLRATPLRFESSSGFVSLVEVGYGRGPDHGTNIECTILSVGVHL